MGLRRRACRIDFVQLRELYCGYFHMFIFPASKAFIFIIIPKIIIFIAFIIFSLVILSFTLLL
jgi:hypothetical protein